MVNKISVETGIGAVNKMTQMFNDIKLSKEMQTEYEKFNSNRNDAEEVKVSVEVLTDGSWPIKEQPTCILPK